MNWPWSLTESQLENLLQTSISVDDVTSPSRYEIAPTGRQKNGKLLLVKLNGEMSHQGLIHCHWMALLSGSMILN